MTDKDKPIRVLHSFPHRLGKARICTTAWYEIDSVAKAGAHMSVLAGDSVRPFENEVDVQTTLSRGKLRIPYKLLGTYRACILHDWLVSKQLPSLAGTVDIIHSWPLGSLQTIKIAKRLGIPVVLERCNAHTRFAYEVVEKECNQIGVPLPKNHEHFFNKKILKHEEDEYHLADAMLCPSDFVVKTFIDQGYAKDKLLRFFYGVDDSLFYPYQDREKIVPEHDGLTMIFAGVCAVRKGLHYALEAWLNSKACNDGKFLIAGNFLPSYKKYLEPLLSHPSVHVLGHRNDLPELMRKSDLFILPSIEEGFGLVCTEAMASGCVPLVSEACTDLCCHMDNSLVHRVGNIDEITKHLDMLHDNRGFLYQLRDKGINLVPRINWKSSGYSLLKAYKKIIGSYRTN